MSPVIRCNLDFLEPQMSRSITYAWCRTSFEFAEVLAMCPNSACGATVWSDREVAGESRAEPLTIDWTETSPDLATAGSGSTFVTPPLVRTSSYFAQASNACGTVSSDPIVVTVEPLNVRKRVVRH